MKPNCRLQIAFAIVFVCAAFQFSQLMGPDHLFPGAANSTNVQSSEIDDDDPRVTNNWPGFRGDGTSTLQANTFPLHWSPETGIQWRTEIPGYGQSAPVIFNGVVYVTSSDGPMQESLAVHAFDLLSGKLLWSASIQASTPIENYFRNSRAAPTCAVDSRAVYAFFASGDVVALDHRGQVLWQRGLFQEFGTAENERGTASSPAQDDERLYLVVDHHGPSYILALEKASGRTAWKTDRGNRVPSWSSPVVIPASKPPQVVISSADTVEGYSLSNGERLWRFAGLTDNHIPSLTVQGNRLYIGASSLAHVPMPEEKVARSNCCLELTSENDVPGYRVLWSAERATAAYATPLAFAQQVYYVNNSGVLFCINDSDGSLAYPQRLGTSCWASAIGVTLADGQQRVYLFRKNGFTTVLAAGDEFHVLASCQLWDREEMTAAAEAASAMRKKNAVPAESQKPKTGPEAEFGKMPEKQLHQMFSYGDPTVYGVAAVDGHLVIRTGQHLYAIAAARSDQ